MLKDHKDGFIFTFFKEKIKDQLVHRTWFIEKSFSTRSSLVLFLQCVKCNCQGNSTNVKYVLGLHGLTHKNNFPESYVGELSSSRCPALWRWCDCFLELSAKLNVFPTLLEWVIYCWPWVLLTQEKGQDQPMWRSWSLDRIILLQVKATSFLVWKETE